MLIGLMDYEKSIGRVNMRKLLVKGGDLQVFQFDRNDRKKVEKMAKKYGILYSVLPGVNKEQGKMEIVFHSEAVPRVNMMIQKLKMGKMSTFDEYLREDGGKNAEELANFLEKEKKGGFREEDRVANEAIDGLLEKVGNFAMEREAVSSGLIKENFSVSQSQAQSVLSQLERMGVLSKVDERGMHKVLMDKEAFQNRIRGYRELMDRMKAVSKSMDASLVDVTISKNLIAEENEVAVKTRVPGTWGENARFLWVKKENIMEIHGGKTLLTFLEKEKDYKLYDEENRVVEVKKGEKLYSGHYDSVEIGLRQRYEKMQKEKEKREKQVEAAIEKLAAGKARK